METKELIKQYLEAHRLAWSSSTLKSEASRLHSLRGWVKVDPALTFEQLSPKYKPYTVKTMFVRMAKLWDWAIQEEKLSAPNPYAKFLKTHRNLFKNAYKKERLDVTFEEARKLLESIRNDAARRKAEQMLTSGLRISEAFGGIQEDGTVIGKGNKSRPYFGRHYKDDEQKISAEQFRRHLRALGLKPHTLRKLFATKLVDSGMPLQDVMHIMGWSSLETARSYLQTKKDEVLANQIKGILNEA
jgi:integrase